MSTICSCDTGAGGFGLIDCYGAPDRVVGLGFQQLKNGGSINAIESPVAQADWEGHLWSKVGGERISLLNDVKAYTSERDDAVTETIDTIDYFISEGKKMVSFQIIGAPAKLKAYVDSLRCQTIGFYGVSASGQLLGKRSPNDLDVLYPIPVQNQTIYSKIIDKTKETLAKMQVTFMIDERFDDADFVYIPTDQITANLLTTEALIEATATAGATTTTTTTMDIQLDFSLSGRVSPDGLEPLQNFDDAAYFAIYNNTTLASVAVSAVSESSTTAGLYTIEWTTAQTTADVLEFSASAASPFYFTPFTATSL